MIDAHTVEWINGLPREKARTTLLDCCGSQTWAAGMAAERPHRDGEALAAACERCFDAMGEVDWLEAFAAHPRIGKLPASHDCRPGGDRATDRGAAWSACEQSRVETASGETLTALEDANERYEARFGFTFIICASGRSAEGMLAAVRDRLGNTADVELANAAREQRKITALRLGRLGERGGEST